MPHITLVAEENARAGFRFDYLGPDILCDGCGLRGICFNLVKGARYRIVAVRDTYHPCEATEGRMRVVEVERTERPVAVDPSGAIAGQTLSMTVPRCHNLGCAHYRLCHPYGIDGGDKVTVRRVGEKLGCPAGKARSLVIIERRRTGRRHGLGTSRP